MITPIRHPKLHKDIAYLHSKSEATHECVSKTENKNEYKGITTNQSASANFEGGFFSPKNRDSVSFSGGKDWFNKKLQSQKFLEGLGKVGNSLAMIEAYLVFGISTTIKPISILMMPGSKKEDKQYNAAKAFVGGCVDFGLASITVKPIAKRLEAFVEKVKKHPEIVTDRFEYLKKPENLKSFKTFIGYLPKYTMIPVRSALTIALLPATMRLFFPEEAKKMNPKTGKRYVTQVAQTPQTNKSNREIVQVSSDKKKVMAGGAR